MIDEDVFHEEDIYRPSDDYVHTLDILREDTIEEEEEERLLMEQLEEEATWEEEDDEETDVGEGLYILFFYPIW